LQNYPEEPIHVLNLTHMIESPDYSGFSFRQVQQLLLNQSTIPQTDVVTLKQVDNELNRLIKLKAWRQSVEADCSDIDKTIQQLVSYRKETTRPNGTIKGFRSAVEREYQRHQKAIQRLLKKAKKDCPDAYAYIRNHLKSGIYFQWVTDDIDNKKFVFPTIQNKKKTTTTHRRC